MIVTWQEHLERCAKLGISPKVMTETEWQGVRPKKSPRQLSESEKEALLAEAHDTGARIAGMKLLPETLATCGITETKT